MHNTKILRGKIMTSDNILPEIELLIEHKERINHLSGENDKNHRLTEWEIDEIEERFNKIISEIKDERDGIIREKNILKDAVIKANKMEIAHLYGYVSEVGRKLTILRNKAEVEDKDISIKNETIHPYHDREIWFHGTAYKDEYLNLIGLVVENDKPKNKYSLYVYGKCSFPEVILKPPCGYGMGTHEDTQFNIKLNIRDKPTLKEQQDWFKTGKTETIGAWSIPTPNNISLLNFLHQYLRVKQEYRDVIERYTMDDFKPLFMPKQATDDDSPIVFKLDKKEVRLHENFYYQEVSKIDKEDISDPNNCIKYIQVDKKIYHKICRKEIFCIKQTGNTMFGNWWSFDLGKYDNGYGCSPFNKKTYEEEVEKTKKWIKKKNKNRNEKIRVNYPKVEWVKPELI